jgi:hypothetical protein
LGHHVGVPPFRPGKPFPNSAIRTTMTQLANRNQPRSARVLETAKTEAWRRAVSPTICKACKCTPIGSGSAWARRAAIPVIVVR